MTGVIKAKCEHGVTVGRHYDMTYPLTPCHEASGKGSEVETGVVCRACYEEVSPMYGDWAPLEQAEEAVPWFNERGCPDPMLCAGRVFAQLREAVPA